MPYRPGVMAVLYTDDGYLLTQRPDRDDGWYFPSGQLHPTESIRDAFYREICDTLGLEEPDLHGIRTLSVELDQEGDQHGTRRQEIVIAELDPDAVMDLEDQNEISGVRTVPAEEVPDVLADAVFPAVWHRLLARAPMPHQ